MPLQPEAADGNAPSDFRNRGFTGGMQRGHHGMGNGNTDLGGAHFLFYSPDTFGLRISVSDDPVPAAFSGDSPAWIGGADDHFVDVDTSRRSV